MLFVRANFDKSEFERPDDSLHIFTLNIRELLQLRPLVFST